MKLPTSESIQERLTLFNKIKSKILYNTDTLLRKCNKMNVIELHMRSFCQWGERCI